MTKDEALRLALEALGNCYSTDVQQLKEAITAIREALAEQDDPDLQDKDPELVEPSAQQEPLEYWNAVEGWVKIDEVRQHFDSVGCGTIYKTAGEGRVPLYQAEQPAQQAWNYKETGRNGVYTPAQQEPVAVVSGYYGGQCVITPTNPAMLFNPGTALYTSPQPAQQKPVAWVSRTGHGTYFRESITPELEALEFGGNKMWTPLYEYPQSAQRQEPAAWRELCRRLYVELFHCDQQMTGTRDENGEPIWEQGATVRDVLADAKSQLESSPYSSKPWAGLTDDEFQFIYDNGNTPTGMMEMVETKLKEKNA